MTFRERQKRSKEQMYVLVNLPSKRASNAEDPTPVVRNILRNRIDGPKNINTCSLQHIFKVSFLNYIILIANIGSKTPLGM